MSTSPPQGKKLLPKAPAAEPDPKIRPPRWVDTSFRKLLDAIPDATLVVNRAGEIVVANLQVEKLFGYRREKLIGRSVESLMPPRLRADHPQHRGNFFGDPRMRPMGVGLELFALRGDGTEVPVEISLSPLATESGTFVISAIRDVTDRRRTQELKASEERSKRLVQSSSVAMIVSRGLEQKVELMNHKFTALFGYTIDDVPDVDHWWTLAYPDEAYRQAVRTEWQARVEKAIRNVTDIEPMEATVRCKDGSTRHIEAHLSCMGDTNLVTLIDLTERKRAEEALRGSEARLRLAAQAGKMYAYEWDVATDMIMRSPEYVNILGLSGPATQRTRQQILDRVHPDDHALLIGSVDQLTPTNPTTQISYRMLRPDGAVIWLGTSGRAFFDAQGRLVRMIGMVADITERKLAEEALASVSRKLIEAQEQERTRIARELHDDIGQRLALLTIGLLELQQNSPDLPAEVRNRIDELRKQTSAIATDTQSLSHELHSSKLQYLGIVAAMRGFCKEIGEQQNVEIDFQTHDLPIPLSPDISLCFFRVLQEALHNSVKHSGVRHFEVRLWGTSDEIHLTVSDSGAGFDREKARKGRGLGLISMEERLKLVNGTFSIESQPQRGTTIHARVPLNAGSDSVRAAG